MGHDRCSGSALGARQARRRDHGRQRRASKSIERQSLHLVIRSGGAPFGFDSKPVVMINGQKVAASVPAQMVPGWLRFAKPAINGAPGRLKEG